MSLPGVSFELSRKAQLLIFSMPPSLFIDFPEFGVRRMLRGHEDFTTKVSQVPGSADIDGFWLCPDEFVSGADSGE
jgi:hypothetical protein